MKKVRPIRIDGDVAYIPLSKGYEAVIDAADVPLVSGWNWYAQAKPDRTSVYAVRNEKTADGQKTVLLHRVISGAVGAVLIDHRDTDGLNNRRHNLRAATHNQNQHNRRVQSNSSGLKGVCWHKGLGKWCAQIRVNGRLKHLGLFATPEDGHSAYAAASATYHGEFGRTA